jgi:hypothetical protein
MKCNICKVEVNKGNFGTIAGFICTDPACQEAAAQQRRDFFAREWEPADIPDAGALNESMTLFADKLIKHFEKNQPKKWAKIKESNPLMGIPEELQLDITEKVIAALPREYYTEERSRGHIRMFHGGTFCLLKPIPADVLSAAMEKAGYIKTEKGK